MALIKCKECGNGVSKKAESCPQCGAPVKKKRENIGCGAVILGLFIIGIFVNILSPDEPAKPQKPKTAEELRTDKLAKCFSAWNGSHRNLETLVKKSMNDPDSYEHDETRYSDKGDHLIVQTTFRGKNGFGGVVKNTVIAKTALNCDVTEVISQN